MTIQATGMFEKLLSADKRKVILVGGAGSSKSHSMEQFIIYKLTQEQGKTWLITRKTNPALRKTMYQEILDKLHEYGIKFKLNATEMVLKLHNNTVYFQGIDDPEKIKSLNLNYVVMEEATEFNHNDFMQLNLRLRKPNEGINQIFLLLNPIDENHWIKTKLIDLDPETLVIRSNYKDNPFLDETYIKDLESLQLQNPNYYRIYALGEWGILEDTIYSNWDTITDIPEGEIIYGVDFGFRNPSVVLQITLKEDDIYVSEMMYDSNKLTSDIISRLKELPEGCIYCDAAEPDRIEEMYKTGLKVYPARKDVQAGIDLLKRLKIHILKDSVNTIKEIQGYAWRKDKNDNVLDEPIKFNDHSMDALRYAVYTHARETVPELSTFSFTF